MTKYQSKLDVFMKALEDVRRANNDLENDLRVAVDLKDKDRTELLNLVTQVKELLRSVKV